VTFQKDSKINAYFCSKLQNIAIPILFYIWLLKNIVKSILLGKRPYSTFGV
jgi:hypothetical protein